MRRVASPHSADHAASIRPTLRDPGYASYCISKLTSSFGDGAGPIKHGDLPSADQHIVSQDVQAPWSPLADPAKLA